MTRASDVIDFNMEDEKALFHSEATRSHLHLSFLISLVRVVTLIEPSSTITFMVL